AAYTRPSSEGDSSSLRRVAAFEGRIACARGYYTFVMQLSRKCLKAVGFFEQSRFFTNFVLYLSL
ncbi:MAG: hypothetical protein ACK4P1_07975, partial [Aggregatilineales bacterium]